MLASLSANMYAQLVLLDLYSEFDHINHDILLFPLCMIVISGSVLIYITLTPQIVTSSL